MKPRPCDNYQARMSELIDDGLPFPDSVHQHLISCPECAAFARIFGEPHSSPLAGPLPAAGADLRQRILRLPQSRPSRSPRSIAALSAIAAAMVLMITAWWFTRPIPGPPSPPQITQDENKEVQMEIAALKEDLNQAFGQLAEPLAAFNSLMQP